MTEDPRWDVMDVLCPMHLILDASGKVVHVGPTTAKLSKGNKSLIGRQFLDFAEIKRPREVKTLDDFQETAGRKLHLEMHDACRTPLKGIMLPLPRAEGAMIVNLSFGISIIDGVREYALTNADFAATDLAIEMLFLVEAKTAAMDASHRMNQRLRVAKQTAEEQAFTDALTGLRNRRAMDLELTRLLAAEKPFAVMHIDLDYFKAVNDTLGHAAGDFVLERVAAIMLNETRESDCVARVGGDEFTVILPHVKDEATLRRIGERIITALEIPIPFEGEVCNISASIGTVWLKTATEIDKDELLSNADVALYASKHAGRAQQTFYSPELREAANAGVPPVGRGTPSTDAA